jgi:cytochrome c oxidase subunit 2
MQHAHMAFDIVVESDEEFANWLDAMRQPSRNPPDTLRRGRDVFMQAGCAACHTIRGSDAAAQTAPDLTHIASRSSLGAGSLPNTPDNLATWIRDSQGVKPGNQMPPNPLTAEDLQVLVSYLETLR